MTNQEILTKAIEKAIAGGWDSFDVTEWFNVYSAGNGRIQVEFRPRVDGMGLFYDYTAVIFSHDFAKALWGDAAVDSTAVNSIWQYHLQQMVIAEDPIKYLGANLPD